MAELTRNMNKKDATKTDEDGGADEEYEPDVHFKPVIPLPELIVVKTGEEGEAKLFCERVKLYRFVPESKEWKERGIGEFKILKNEESGKVRLLMRREQVHKICCNHSLSPDMEFSPMQSSDKAWTWSAPDFSKGEIVNELFAVKFKNVDMATNWIDIIKDCQKDLKDRPATSPTKAAEPTPAAPASSGGTLAQFAASQKSSTWECQLCLVRNDMAKIQCMSCESAKPGHEEEVKKLQDAAKPAAPVMTIGAGGGFKFTPSVETAPAAPASGFMFGSTTTKPITTQTTTTSSTSSTGFTFGNGAAKTTEKPVTKLGGFSFTNDPVVQKEEAKEIAKPKIVAEVKTVESTKPSPFSGFTFSPKVDSKSGPFGSTVESLSTPAKSVDATDCKTDLFGGKSASGLSSFGNLAGASSEGFAGTAGSTGFAGAGAQVFGSQAKKDATKTDEDDGADEEYEPDVHFKPVIPLPELIVVKTGEEGEAKLFCERVKLYRFVPESKEWKERGIGEFKILKNEESGKVRLLMRREQVHKICCNHSLSPDMEFSPMQSSDKAWTWSAPDFSEGEIVNELFAVKFKNVDMATNWIDIIKDCQKDLKDRPATS